MKVSVQPGKGVWITIPGHGDVHVYQENKSFVLGTNSNYKDKIDFSDIAVKLEDGKILIQYADEKGEPVHKDLPVNVFVEEYLAFLNKLKAYAKEDH